MVLVIGIVGKKQSGKDTFADHVIRCHPGKRICKYSMASPLKDACRLLFHLSNDQLHDEVEKETPDPRWGGKTPRQLFQWLGTDVFREQFDDSFWVRHAAHQIRELASHYDVIIIPDIRFKNEAEFVRSFPSHRLVRVRRSIRSDDKHISESEIEEIPLSWIHTTTYNTGSMDEYIAHIHEMICGLIQDAHPKTDG